jgi:hypothetical protein
MPRWETRDRAGKEKRAWRDSNPRPSAYEVEDIETRLEDHNRQLEEWHRIYNYDWPHQAFKYLTPAEFFERWLKEYKPKRH